MKELCYEDMWPGLQTISEI